MKREVCFLLGGRGSSNNSTQKQICMLLKKSKSVTIKHNDERKQQ